MKRTISWNEYLAKPELLAQNANLNHLIEPSFERIAFEDDSHRINKKKCYLPNIEIKDDNVMVDGKKKF